MRKCSQCGRYFSDIVDTCTHCGAPLTGGAANNRQQSYTPPVQQNYTPPVQQTYTPPVQQNYTPPVQQGYSRPVITENVGKGILGAFLFALGGAAIQGLLINIGKVAAIVGFVTHFLAVYGYQKFSGAGSNSSKKATWLCIPISLIMIILGTFVGTAVVVARVAEVSLPVAFRLLFENESVLEAIGQDVGFTVVLWAVGVLISLIPRKKKK